MSLIVPSVGAVAALRGAINADLTLRLYSNNKAPASADTIGSYTEVAGGGYVAKLLTVALWLFTEYDPSYARYAHQDFRFTSTTTAPGTIYGYYIIEGDGILRWAERFPEGIVPFTPVNGSLIRITPRIEA